MPDVCQLTPVSGGEGEEPGMDGGWMTDAARERLEPPDAVGGGEFAASDDTTRSLVSRKWGNKKQSQRVRR